MGWKRGGVKRHFGGLVGYSVCRRNLISLQDQKYLDMRERTVGKYDFKLEQTSFPEGLLFARNTTLPALEIHGTVFTLGFGEEAEWMVAPPLLAESFWSDIQCITSLDILHTVLLAICFGTTTL